MVKPKTNCDLLLWIKFGLFPRFNRGACFVTLCLLPQSKYPPLSSCPISILIFPSHASSSLKLTLFAYIEPSVNMQECYKRFSVELCFFFFALHGQRWCISTFGDASHRVKTVLQLESMAQGLVTTLLKVGSSMLWKDGSLSGENSWNLWWWAPNFWATVFTCRARIVMPSAGCRRN